MFIKKTYGDFSEIHTKEWSMLLRDTMPMAVSFPHGNCLAKETFEGSPALADFYGGVKFQVVSDEMFDNVVEGL